jgi:hypothetical protein
VVVCVVIPSSDVILAEVRVRCRLIGLFLICWSIGLSVSSSELVSLDSSGVFACSLPLADSSVSSSVMAAVNSWTWRTSCSGVSY